MTDTMLCRTYLGVYDNILDGYSIPLDSVFDIRNYFNPSYGVTRLHVLDNMRFPHIIIVLNHNYIIADDGLLPEHQLIYDYLKQYPRFDNYMFLRCPYTKCRDLLLNLECAIVGNRAHVLSDLDSSVINKCLQ